MARDGDINEPTREFPGYPTGEALKERSAVTTEPDPGAPPPPAGGPARGLLWVLGAAALAVVVLLGVQATGLLPDFRNPFAKEQTDRSQPPLLKSIQDLSRYVAAEGNFQVVVDLQNDRRNMPDWLLSQRTLFVGAGSVEAYVDFAKISEGAVVGVGRRQVGGDQAAGAAARQDQPRPGEELRLRRGARAAQPGRRAGQGRPQPPAAGLPARRGADHHRRPGQRPDQRAEENTRKMLEGLLAPSATRR